MVTRRQRVMNGKVFYITRNDSEKAVEIKGSDDKVLAKIPYGRRCDTRTETALKKLSEQEE